MNCTEQELIDFFRTLYDSEEEIQEIRESIKDDLNDFATKSEIDKKALNSAFSYFKKYAKGKSNSREMEETSVLNDIIDRHMSVE